MSLTVRFKLHKEEQQAVLDFCNQLGLELDFVAKKALFMAIQESYKRARDLEQKAREDGTYNTASENTEGALESDDQGATSDALPNTEEPATQS